MCITKVVYRPRKLFRKWYDFLYGADDVFKIYGCFFDVFAKFDLVGQGSSFGQRFLSSFEQM